MPSTKSIEIFARQHPLTSDDWIQLVENRRELIKPHLDSFSLPTLGSLECLKIEHWMGKLGHETKTSGDERFSLKTQGIFFLQPHNAIERFIHTEHRGEPGNILPSDGTKKAWGLTRSGQWIICTIGFVGSSGYKGRGREVATGIGIVEADVPAILAETKTSPTEIWRALGQAIKEFAEHRRRLYSQAQSLANMIEVDELLLRFVPEPSSPV